MANVDNPGVGAARAFRLLVVSVAVVGLAAACSGREDAALEGTAGPEAEPVGSVVAPPKPSDVAPNAQPALPSPAAAPAPAAAPVEVPVSQFVAESCGACHGLKREGLTGPPLTSDVLVAEDAVYFAAIRDGVAGTAMPAWGAAGLSDSEVDTIIEYLRTNVDAPGATISIGTAGAETLALRADTELHAGAVERGSTVATTWPLTNESSEPIVVSRLTSRTGTVFHTGALPVEIQPGQTEELSLVATPNPELGAGEESASSATATVGVLDGSVVEERSVIVRAQVVNPAATLNFNDVPLDGLPVRLASWRAFLYVALFDGTIAVYRLRKAGPPELVERITTVAETLNHGPSGEAEPDTPGRLIGGMTVDEAGWLYVSHSDPRLNEGDFVQTGHLADLNSGMVTQLRGRPGRYSLPHNRLDIATGLPRNVTNHIPSGLDLGPDGALYLSLGAMTDSGVPDPSKPDPDTALSGTVVRIDVSQPKSAYPYVLTEPGGWPADNASLEGTGVSVWATGVRNGFGLAFAEDGTMFLTEQSSDGGAAPQPAGDSGPPGINQNLGADHLHIVSEGDFLGQPNIGRGELVLDDGSAYERPVDSPGFAPPVHVFGVHSSATGLVEYSGAVFADLEGWLLVGKFSGGLGLHALRREGGRVVEERTLSGPPDTRNLTDVALGPNGEIIVAEFWGQRIRIARSYR